MKNVREEEMKKYAIYSAETGLYYYQYADTIELLEGTGFENIITEEQLPVVFDGRGGYFSFDPEQHDFVEIIESDDEVPLPLEKMFYVNQPGFKLGWMSPEGIPIRAAIPTIQNVPRCSQGSSSRELNSLSLPLTERGGSR